MSRMRDFVWTNKERAKRKLLGFLAVFVILSALVAAVYLFGNQNKKEDHLAATKPTPVSAKEEDLGPVPTVKPSAYYNILILGYGGAGHSGGYLTDVVKVVNINVEKAKATVISIPRDLWVELPVRSDMSDYFKINEAYAIGFDDRNYPLKEPEYKGQRGAANMAKKAMEQVIGMPIDYYLAVDFSGFKGAIDILEGVEVFVPKTFDDYFYPVKGLENETCGKNAEEIAELHQKYSGFELEKQFECRYEHLHFDEGKVLMDGETALKFVRSRHSDQHGGDFARAQRQLALVDAVYDKAVSLKALDDLPSFARQFYEVITTDLNTSAIKVVVERISDPSSFTVASVDLTDENVLISSKSSVGQFILIPKEGVGEWEKVQNYIQSKL